MCFRWKYKKSCNERAAQVYAEPKQNFLLISKSYQRAKSEIDCSPKTADCLSLPKLSCAVFVSSEIHSIICFHPTIRHMREYLKLSWWVAPNYIYYGIFFPHWNGAFGRKSCSHYHALLTSLEHTKHRLREERWARHGQAVASAANSKHDWYLHQLHFPKPWGKSWSIFNSIH